ncbi:ribonuclease catalytic domain-containing protein [Chitinilyticum piscinae]|uniref:RNB domain-containing ribonuclease n=1 Tax=Chitinilyticum piscinae TaxID=2866724 RepID=A0A8J7KGD6_9NEIS|nr:ribonuclease catalytic domain-containing protein [Chitinilyticum piscinae]MBE9610329.1 RNB domain-containing ribonuclease [Chitinilyticum piscinae]
MNVFYEEDGHFKVATIKDEQQASLMVEDQRGKRSKIKSANVLLRFDRIGLEEFISAAEAAAAEIDTDFLWECCGADEFGFQDIALEYFGKAATPQQQAAAAIGLHAAPMYFYRKGRGRYKAAPEENLKAAKAGLERKQREAEQMAAWQAELAARKLPQAFAPQLNRLLFRPDKNSIEWKALAAAADAAQLSPLRLLERVGAIPSVERYFFDEFQHEYFPKGLDFPSFPELAAPADLPVANVRGFSIDDATTTEIDDAFSLVQLPNGNWQVGIHIAAPVLGIAPGTPLDQVILDRLSTVYMPGNKITMLPDAAVEVFTLQEGAARPALSMYLEVNAGYEILSHRSVIECVPIVANLRHDQIEPLFNEETAGRADTPDFEWKDELTWLWRFAGELEGRRGKAENQIQRLDYSFYIDRDGPSEVVRIVPRKRGAPMDKLVAELMILVNSQWGKNLRDAQVAGIYRAQVAGRVRMTTQPGQHIGLGVECYAWSSSPLRRAVDFVNQTQLIALLRNEKPRFQKNDAELYSIISNFDTAYAAYADFQDKMERYWCLRYIEQENLRELSASVIKENLVRIEGMPLVVRVGGLPELPAGTNIKLQRLAIDYLDLQLELRMATL